MPDQRPTAKIPPLSTWEMIDPRGAWYHPISGIRVISTLDDAEYPDDSGEIGPQWHVSVTRVGSGRVPLHPSQRDVDFAIEEKTAAGVDPRKLSWDREERAALEWALRNVAKVKEFRALLEELDLDCANVPPGAEETCGECWPCRAWQTLHGRDGGAAAEPKEARG